MQIRHQPIPYGYAILSGIGLGLLFSLRDYLFIHYLRENYTFEWPRLWLHLANYVTWGLIFPLVNHLIYRVQNQESRLWLPARILFVGLGLSVLHEAISNVMFFGGLHLGGKEQISADTLRHIIKALPAALVSRMIEFGILYLIYSAFAFQRKLRNQRVAMAQMETQLTGAQLSALRLQLQPHFLFNTLNTISSLMEFDKKQAQQMVSRLGHLLRSVLDQNKTNRIPLREELEFSRNYLSIEQIRFQDRLKVVVQAPTDVLDAQVPSLILQPLVENAIKHGFANQSGDGQITVQCRLLEDGKVEVKVSDDGQGSSRPAKELLNSGIGLQNVRDRLELIYKSAASLSIDTAKGDGFTATVVLPYQHS
ncbi:sensor histidine kinase [Phaeodactylibacter luteus]|uniref:Histidine kinase domain-containing protein n=1 Tax=Phaeodactylibacter luteus TaxID=1564516 RepID=A0A5C6RNT6_9BACT|nr:histidine kinase [Phaeodactylibacter luteus]TXB63609.1 hypothetical protein FRY97_08785 [Phaeodactylibacter luteus]